MKNSFSHLKDYKAVAEERFQNFEAALPAALENSWLQQLGHGNFVGHGRG
jgi:hypothetical protein